MGFFLNGSEYKNTTEVPRKTCCETCAFREGPGTVRPEGVEPDDVWEETNFCEDFVCHTADENGAFPSCAAWHARKCAAMAGGRTHDDEMTISEGAA